jgi:NAD+ kinase
MGDDHREAQPLVRRLGLVLRPDSDVSEALAEVRAWAAETGVVLVGSRDESRLPDDVTREPDESLARDCDAVLALGGDGTVLGAMRLAGPHRTPVVGVNLGTLGYLTEVDGAHIAKVLDALAQGRYAIEMRSGLVLAEIEDIPEQIVYNDVVVTRAPGRGQAALALRIDGELLVRYASDGVIAATPQGSTAYAFAAGGPLVSPWITGMIVMPDAPHGLFNRAVVLAGSERLGIEVLRRSAPVSIERDGRLLGHVEAGARLEVSVTPDAARLVRVHPRGFAGRARRKLGITDPAGLADFDLAGHER